MPPADVSTCNWTLVQLYFETVDRKQTKQKKIKSFFRPFFFCIFSMRASFYVTGNQWHLLTWLIQKWAHLQQLAGANAVYWALAPIFRNTIVFRDFGFVDNSVTSTADQHVHTCSSTEDITSTYSAKWNNEAKGQLLKLQGQVWAYSCVSLLTWHANWLLSWDTENETALGRRSLKNNLHVNSSMEKVKTPANWMIQKHSRHFSLQDVLGPHFY